MNPRDYPNLNFSDEVFCRHDVQYRKLEMNGHEKLKLQVLGVHQSGIYCISFTDVADFLKDDQKTQNYGSQLQIYYPYEAKNHLEMVVAKIGSSWYRCLFLASISATEVRVFLIDYGIELVAAKENIRAFSRQISYTVRAVTCVIDNGITEEEKKSKYRCGTVIEPKSIVFDSKSAKHVIDMGETKTASA